jgi:hypothetical protein
VVKALEKALARLALEEVKSQMEKKDAENAQSTQDIQIACQGKSDH